MLTLEKAGELEIASVETKNKPIEDLLTREWLLTNNRGGYASSTIVGCNTRRYHGLLIGSLNPPVNRIMALANYLEMVILKTQHSGASATSDDSERAFAKQNMAQNGCYGEVFNLSTFEFSDKFAPAGYGFIKQFRRDIGVHFDYELPALELTKSIYLLPETDTVAVLYNFTDVRSSVEFVLRPLIGLRDFHILQKSYASLCARQLGDGLLIHHDVPHSCGLLLSCPDAKFEKDQQWWFNFVYRQDKQRGQDFNEDLWTPGFFKCCIEKPVEIVCWASLCNHRKLQQPSNWDIQEVCNDLRRHQSSVIAAAKSKDKKLMTLCLAADQFVTKRQTNNIEHKSAQKIPSRTTILAGFPWFADWGRDAFISLPGLLLSTGRFEKARSVLTTFARAVDDGMIPSRFDDHSDTAYFNSVDTSLWFVNAAFQYLNATGNSKTFEEQLLPTICWIIDSYQQGSRFGIHADNDGLITAGDQASQLTWMDAKYQGIAFTPRCGKAVEVNALWYNSLCVLSQFYTGRNTQNEKHYESMAKRVADSFRELFWNESKSYLNDCILPDGSVDETLRPNQIYAVSLTFSPLQTDQQKLVVDVVQKNLLTPYGLRTLNTQDNRYKGKYTGPQQHRDQAYHQGTVWPYLIGPFIEAYLKVNGSNRKTKKEAAEFIKPLLKHLSEDACLGQICEVFDGDAPHKPGGCIAQAWSVAELIRAYLLVNT